jgi:hypothetical protein
MCALLIGALLLLILVGISLLSPASIPPINEPAPQRYQYPSRLWRDNHPLSRLHDSW